jgi:hypothetical protein
MTLLEELQAESDRRADAGFIHPGFIHFIQRELSDDEEGSGFTLKAAIYGVLELVPDHVPRDLQVQIESARARDEDYRLTEEAMTRLDDLNQHLLMPIGGWEVLRIIQAADLYLASSE